MSNFCNSVSESETKVLLIPNLSLNNLVDELLIEIFVRLPSKESIQCKSVCKRWNSLITVSILNHHHLVFNLCRIVDRCCFKIEHCFPRKQSQLLDLSFLPCPKSDIHFLSMYVDLMLCCQYNKDMMISCSTNFYIVNLLTQKWIAIPPAPPGLLLDSSSSGFVCQNNDTNRFRIVRIPDYHEKKPSFNVTIQVFSSEKGEWNWFNVSSPRMLKYRGFKRIIAYKGLLHWINVDGIFVYDPFLDPKRFSRFIEPPAGKLRFEDYLGVSQGGHLYIAQLTRRDDPDRITNSSTSVWQLKEDYSWSLRHKMYLRQLSFIGTPLQMYYRRIHSQTCDIRILDLHPADVNILYLKIGFVIVRCDMKNHAILDWVKEKTCVVRSFQLVVNRSGPTPLPHFSRKQGYNFRADFE